MLDLHQLLRFESFHEGLFIVVKQLICKAPQRGQHSTANGVSFVLRKAVYKKDMRILSEQDPNAGTPAFPLAGQGQTLLVHVPTQVDINQAGCQFPGSAKQLHIAAPFPDRPPMEPPGFECPHPWTLL